MNGPVDYTPIIERVASKVKDARLKPYLADAIAYYVAVEFPVCDAAEVSRQVKQWFDSNVNA